MQPQNINTAPMDGTVILSDEGTVRYVDQRYWGCPVTNGWYHCTPHGDRFECADDGPFEAFPKVWIPLPEFMGA